MGRKECDEMPWLFKIFPALIKSSKSGGLILYGNSSRNSGNGEIRQIVYAGPTIAFDPMVSLSDSRYFREIVNNLTDFPKYMPIYNVLGLVIGEGLVTSAGEKHHKQRKIITPVFHFAALKAAMASINQCALEFVDASLILDNYIITNTSFKRFTLGVVIEYAFGGGMDKRLMEASWHTISSLGTTQFILTRFIGDVAKYLPTAFNLQALLLRRRIAQYLAQRRALLREHNITPSTLHAVVGNNSDPAPTPDRSPSLSLDVGLCLADQLLLANCPVSRIVDECATFLSAGHDTSSNLLGWTVYELSRRPDLQVAPGRSWWCIRCTIGMARRSHDRRTRRCAAMRGARTCRWRRGTQVAPGRASIY
jgi:cytochrome P450